MYRVIVYKDTGESAVYDNVNSVTCASGLLFIHFRCVDTGCKITQCVAGSKNSKYSWEAIWEEKQSLNGLQLGDNCRVNKAFDRPLNSIELSYEIGPEQSLNRIGEGEL